MFGSKMDIQISIITVLLVSLLSGCAASMDNDVEVFTKNETMQMRNDRMRWWREARFGMFIHWGLYAVPGGSHNGKRVGGYSEWIMCADKIPVKDYEAYLKDFNPTEYDAEKWVLLAKQAGMKYMVITTKHHDGFAMYHSQVSDYNIVDATPFDRDPIRELADACRKHGMKLGFYYSHCMDWHHPGGGYPANRMPSHWDPALVEQNVSFETYMEEKAIPQLKELLTEYGDVVVLWWDTPRTMNQQRAEAFLPLLDLQPGIITNNRLGGGYTGDYKTPEQYIPLSAQKIDWETCMTMNGSWGFKAHDDKWKSTTQLIENLCDIVSKGGNYLLNVGPDAKGRIPQENIASLKEIGAWMKANGDAVYSTQRGPFARLTWGACSQKVTDGGEQVLYFYVSDWDKHDRLIVPGLKNHVRRIVLLNGGTTLAFEQANDDVVIHTEGIEGDDHVTVLKMMIEGQPDVDQRLPIVNQRRDLKLGVWAAMQKIKSKGEKLTIEHDGEKAWVSKWKSWLSYPYWLVEVTEPGVFDVYATLDRGEDDGVFSVEVCGTRLGTFSEIDTKGSFAEVHLGQVTVDEAGCYQVEVKPKRQGWKTVKLSELRLAPVKD
ncbi:alpha-L-fucosidase [Poriferisphaera sp. WC338]|uniref:alpha-L-fucosidase n=1 Tax=Poriferisphaera sp. WC338 TaxID=3425129 RepID=UPI003D81BDAE